MCSWLFKCLLYNIISIDYESIQWSPSRFAGWPCTFAPCCCSIAIWQISQSWINGIRKWFQPRQIYKKLCLIHIFPIAICPLRSTRENKYNTCTVRWFGRLYNNLITNLRQGVVHDFVNILHYKFSRNSPEGGVSAALNIWVSKNNGSNQNVVDEWDIQHSSNL